MKGELKNGFVFEVSDETLDDMELVDAMAEAQEDNPLKFSKAVRLLLGEEQRKKLYEIIKAEKGRVSVDAVSAAFVEIMQALGEQGKN